MTKSPTVAATGETLASATASYATKQAAMRNFNSAVALQHVVVEQLTERQKLIVAQVVRVIAADWFDDKHLRAETTFSTWLTGRLVYRLSTPTLIMAADALTSAIYRNTFFSFQLKQIDDGLYVCRVVVNKQVLPDVD